MVEKRVKKFGQGSPPPLFRAMPERKRFFFHDGFPYADSVHYEDIVSRYQPEHWGFEGILPREEEVAPGRDISQSCLP